MKKVLCAVLATLLLSGAALAAKMPDGFRGIKWGTPVEKVSGLVLDGGLSKRLKSYSRPDDKLQMENIPLEGLSYDFFDGRFSGVMITVEPEDQEDIIALLTGLYGEPQKDVENENSEPYAWDLYEGGKIRLHIRGETLSLFGGKRTLYRVVYQTPELFQYMESSQWINDQ